MQCGTELSPRTPAGWMHSFRGPRTLQGLLGISVTGRGGWRLRGTVVPQRPCGKALRLIMSRFGCRRASGPALTHGLLAFWQTEPDPPVLNCNSELLQTRRQTSGRQGMNRDRKKIKGGLEKSRGKKDAGESPARVRTLRF